MLRPTAEGRVTSPPATGPDLATPPASAQRAVRNVAIMAACELLGKVATLFFTISAARSLGPAGFGAFSYALTFGLLLATLPSWGFDNVLLRRGSSRRSDLAPALTNVVVWRTIIAVPVLLIGGAAGALSQPSGPTRTAVVLVLLASLLDTYGDAGRAAAQALEAGGRTSIALVAQRIVTAILGLSVLAAGGHLVGVCAAYLISSAVGQLLTALAVKRLGVRPSLRSVDRETLSLLWRQALVIGVNTLVAMALFRVDAVILHALKGDRAVAEYAVAYRLLETVLFFNWIISRAIFPAMAQAVDNRQLLRLIERGIHAIGFVFVPYAVLLLVKGRALLDLLFGAQYLATSTVILRWLALAPLTFGVTFVVGNALLARERNRETLMGSLAGVVVNLGANFALIPVLSGVGAAITTTGSYLASGAVMVWYVTREGGSLRLDRALLLPVLAALPMLGVLIVMPGPLVVSAVVAWAAYLTVYLLLVRWRDPEQLALLTSAMRRS